MKKTSLAALGALMLSGSASFAGIQEIKIAIAGDSTVQNYKTDDIVAGWGQVIKLFFNDNCAIENLAVGGRSTKTFISEGRWDKLLAGKPNFVLIQFGHNDSHAKTQPESTDAAGDYRDFLRKYADDAKAASITPVFITPVHRRLFDKNGEPSAELKPYAEAMKEIAVEKGVFCVDLYEASGKLLKDLGESKSETLYCKPSDRSHFSAEGAYKMAGLIAEGLKDEGSPIKNQLRPSPLPLPPQDKTTSGTKAMPFASVHVFGVNAKVAMSFDGGSDGMTGGPASWMKENADQRLVVNTQQATSEWTKCQFSFTPKSAGTVMLIVMGSDKRSYVCFDDFEVGGSALENGDFEISGNDGLPLKWSALGKPICDSASGKAHSGKAFVKCSQDNRFNANMAVEADRQVSVSFWIKGDDTGN